MMKKTLFATLLFFVFSQLLFAQQGETFSVVDFTEKPFDTAARDERYRIIDGNGELFSIIKLAAATAGDDLLAYSFDFGLCESRVKTVDGEVWVYVQRNAMRAKIRREGYNTVTYELPVTVQPGQVFEMTLQAAPKVIKKRYVIFKVQPADSKALVLFKADGEKDYRPFNVGQVNEEGMLSDKLVLGRYFYKITSQNYHPSEGIIELTDGREAFSETVTLRSNLARVTLDVDKDTEIFIDGESKGFGPWSGELAPGPYNVECRKENHMNSIESIEVRGGETMEFALKSPVPITGALDIMSNPLEATVTIDGKVYGKTPAVIDGVMIGMRKVTLSKDGYIANSFDVEIKEGKTTEKSVTLKKFITSGDGQASQNGNAVIDGHEYVDLGLPSGLKWATCNVDATTPEEYGGYYAWGETEEKENYCWNTYKWCNDRLSRLTKYCTDDSCCIIVDNKTILDLEDDVAHVKWGGSWRMPTIDEYKELIYNCSWKWTTRKRVKGYKVTSKINGKSIFLPAAGAKLSAHSDSTGTYVTGTYYEGSRALYWSSSLFTALNYNASLFFFSESKKGRQYNYRYYGFTVRPVCE